MDQLENPEPMTLRQALSLLLALGTWEIENPAIKPPPPGWKKELESAVATVRQYLTESRSPAGRFFTSPGPLGKRRN